MANSKADAKDEKQIERFKDAARALGCDEDEAAFDEKLKAIARPKPKGIQADGAPARKTKNKHIP